MIHRLYATPLYDSTVKPSEKNKIQQDFLDVIEKLKSRGDFKKNERWDEDTHRLSDPSFESNVIEEFKLTAFRKELEFHIVEYIKGIGGPIIANSKITNSWVTLTNKREYAVLHAHGKSDLAGVYYFQTSGNDGNIYFRNPNRHLCNSYAFGHLQDEVEVKPEVGKILLFPGWLDHGVRTNKEDSERISVSFNITLNPD